MSKRGWGRGIVGVLALIVSVVPVAGVAHAEPTEVTETFVATGVWGATNCNQTSCAIAGNSASCVEIEAVGSVVNTGCRVALAGVINILLFSSNVCELALGGQVGNVAATFYDGSDPGVVVNRVGVAVGGAAVAQAIVITSENADVFNGVLGGLYPPTACPVPTAGTPFVVTTTATIVTP